MENGSSRLAGDTSGERQWVMVSLLPPPPLPTKVGPLAVDQATEPKEAPLPLSDQRVGSQVQQTAVIWAQAKNRAAFNTGAVKICTI